MSKLLGELQVCLSVASSILSWSQWGHEPETAHTYRSIYPAQSSVTHFTTHCGANVLFCLCKSRFNCSVHIKENIGEKTTFFDKISIIQNSFFFCFFFADSNFFVSCFYINIITIIVCKAVMERNGLVKKKKNDQKPFPHSNYRHKARKCNPRLCRCYLEPYARATHWTRKSRT